MDKVIIDGVDVSGCDSYTSNYREPMPYGEIKVTEHYCWHINSNCDGKNCDYKEIKRLQQENEELKAKYKQCANENLDEIYELIKKNDCWRGIVNVVNEKLEKENEDLKTYIKKMDKPEIKTIDSEIALKNIELQAENERLKQEIKQYKKYKFLFEKAKEFKEKTDKWASKCLAENEDLKDTIKRTVCQSECFRYKQANTYKQALQEIRDITEKMYNTNDEDVERDLYIKLQDKINEVIGAE